MRTFIVLSLAVTTALASTTAFAANGQDPFQRRLPRVQQGFAPAIKPAGQGGQIATFSRLPVQTIANPVRPTQTFQAQPPIAPRVNFAPPVLNVPKPVVTQAQFQVQLPPKPVIQTPVIPIKQELPVSRQIVPEARDPAPVKTIAAPAFQAVQTPDTTGTLQAEIPAAQPAAPLTTDKPADAQALIDGDTAAAPQVEPVTPVRPHKRIVRVYVQAEQTYDDYGQQNYSQDTYSYQPRVSYSYDNSYGSDGCQ